VGRLRETLRRLDPAIPEERGQLSGNPDSSISIPEDDEPMSKKKSTPGGRAKKKAEVSLVRSSAAEYLTFVAASGQGGVEAVYADEMSG